MSIFGQKLKKKVRKTFFCQKNTLPCFDKQKNVLELHMKLLNEDCLKKFKKLPLFENLTAPCGEHNSKGVLRNMMLGEGRTINDPE